MIRIMHLMASDETTYIPAPCRGKVSAAYAVYQTNAVEPADTITISRGATTVNLITVPDTTASTAGTVIETGVPDATNKDLIFDPADDTAANTVIKAVSAGAAGTAMLVIEFDEFAIIEEDSVEA